MMRLFLTLCIILFAASPSSAAVKVQQVKGTNGQEAWMIEDHTLPVITVRMQFANSGSAYDRQGKEGLASFVTQLLDEGAGSMDSLAFNHAMEQHAIRFGAQAGEDTIVISLQTLSEYKTDAFSLLSTALQKPRFDSEAVERIRASITSDLKYLNENPVYVASLRWKQEAFPNHPYGRPKRGTPDSIAAITRDDLVHYWNSVFTCNKKYIAIVGDINAADAAKLMDALFPPAACITPLKALEDITPADGISPIHVEKAVPQTVVHASIPAIKRNAPNYYAMVLLNDIFAGDTLTGRLGKEMRDKQGLAYYAESGINEMDHAAYISIHFASRSDQLNNAVGVFLNVIDNIQKKGVSDAELKDEKRYLTGSFPLNLDSQGSLAEYLVDMQRYALGIDYLDKRNHLIEAVTLPQVNQLAKELFSHKPLIVTVGQQQGDKK